MGIFIVLIPVISLVVSIFVIFLIYTFIRKWRLSSPHLNHILNKFNTCPIVKTQKLSLHFGSIIQSKTNKV